MNVVPLSLASSSANLAHVPNIHADKSDRITGWRLLAIWLVLIAGSWALFLSMIWAAAELAR